MNTRTTDQLAEAVRGQLRLGRLVPLGDAADGAWITEQAAAGVLRVAGAGVPGVRPGAVQLSLADPDTAEPSAVPPPPSALPYGPLLLAADFEAVGDVPLPLLAERLRAELGTAARDRLGLPVDRLDLRVTGLLERAPDGGDGAGSADGPPLVAAGLGGGALEDSVAYAVSAAPGVAGLAPALGGGAARGVRITRLPVTETAARPGPPALRIRVEIAAAPDHRALDAARAARAAVTDAVAHAVDGPAGPAAVTVLITAIRPAAGHAS